MNLSNLDINNIDFDSVISRIFLFLTSPETQVAFLPVQIAFMVVSIILLGIIIFVLSRTHYLQWLVIQDAVQFITMRPFGAKKMTRQWGKIAERLETGLETEYKLAIIEADDMMDASLKRMGYDGQTLEKKLEKLTLATLPNIQQLYEVHQLRNNVVHDPDYQLSLEEAKKALDAYNQALRDLQILSE